MYHGYDLPPGTPLTEAALEAQNRLHLHEYRRLSLGPAASEASSSGCNCSACQEALIVPASLCNSSLRGLISSRGSRASVEVESLYSGYTAATAGSTIASTVNSYATAPSDIASSESDYHSCFSQLPSDDLSSTTGSTSMSQPRSSSLCLESQRVAESVRAALSCPQVFEPLQNYNWALHCDNGYVSECSLPHYPNLDLAPASSYSPPAAPNQPPQLPSLPHTSAGVPSPPYFAETSAIPSCARSRSGTMHRRNDGISSLEAVSVNPALPAAPRPGSSLTGYLLRPFQVDTLAPATVEVDPRPILSRVTLGGEAVPPWVTLEELPDLPEYSVVRQNGPLREVPERGQREA